MCVCVCIQCIYMYTFIYHFWNGALRTFLYCFGKLFYYYYYYHIIYLQIKFPTNTSSDKCFWCSSVVCLPQWWVWTVLSHADEIMINFIQFKSGVLRFLSGVSSFPRSAGQKDKSLSMCHMGTWGVAMVWGGYTTLCTCRFIVTRKGNCLIINLFSFVTA